jgi:uncharacterized membrane protein
LVSVVDIDALVLADFHAAILSFPACMNPSYAPGSWSPTVARQSPTSAPAPEAMVPLAEGVGDGGGLQWRLQRNCSLAPRKLIAVFASLCVLSMSIAAGFWWLGAPAVLPYAGVELLALGLAFALYARHAGDGEHVTLQDGELRVEHHRGGRIERAVFCADWVRLDGPRGTRALLALNGEGRQAFVGRYVGTAVRFRFAVELRSALSAARCAKRSGDSADSPHQAKSSENRP